MSEAATLQSELGHLRQQWWWFTILGVLLVACGVVAIASPFLSSLYFVVLLGIVLLLSGIATIIGSFWAGKWSAFLLQMLVGIIYTVAGIAVADAPVESTLVLTLLIASFLIVVGLFRIVAALVIRFPQWGWVLLNGIVTLVAGVVIYRHFPASGFWVIGLVVGLELLMNGVSWIMLSLAIRPETESTQGTPGAE